jgi:phage terminase large subunit-like protein
VRGLDPDDVVRFLSLVELDTGDRWRVEPFQRAAIEDLCAGVDVLWWEMPEGNGKSSTLAGLALAHLFFTPEANLPIAASSAQQATVLLRQATGMIARSDDLAGAFRPLEGSKRIDCPGSGGQLKIHAADAGTGDGVIPSLAILEELHRHPSLDLYRTWRGKLAKRRGQLVIISTSGAPESEYEVAKEAAIARCGEMGSVERTPGLLVARMPGFAMRVHGIAAGEDSDDLEAVKRANPLSSITVETLREKRQDPNFLRSHWDRFTCGRPARVEESAVNEQEWLALEREDIPPGVEVAVGVDFGWKFDTTALVPLWMPSPDQRVLGTPTIIVPPRDGTSTSTAVVREAFIRLRERNPISVVAMDPAAGGRQFGEWLESPPTADGSVRWEDGGGLGVEVVEVSPGNATQCAAYAVFMEAIRTGVLHHPHDPDLTRHVLNARAKLVTHDRYRFDRPVTSRHARLQDSRVIDALIAASIVHWQQTAGLDDDSDPWRSRPFSLDDYKVVTL